MIAYLLLVLLVTFSGTVATYLYDENASLAARLCAGAAIGLAALGLIGCVVASLVGLNVPAVLFSAVICCSPLALLTDGTIMGRLRKDIGAAQVAPRRLTKADTTAVGSFLFYVVVAVVLCKVFSRAVIEESTGLSTGL